MWSLARSTHHFSEDPPWQGSHPWQQGSAVPLRRRALRMLCVGCGDTRVEGSHSSVSLGQPLLFQRSFSGGFEFANIAPETNSIRLSNHKNRVFFSTTKKLLGVSPMWEASNLSSCRCLCNTILKVYQLSTSRQANGHDSAHVRSVPCPVRDLEWLRAPPWFPSNQPIFLNT